MSENTMPSSEDYIKSLECTNAITEKAIRAAINELGLFDGCTVLDVPCGIGNHSLWMAEENPHINIVGVDFAEDHLDYARKLELKKSSPVSVIFEKGDIRKLDFDDNTFDFVWCCDGLRPGPREAGCVAEEPYEILDGMTRITKDGGKIAALFWSGQKLLPGYPLLEAELNSTFCANKPVIPGADPDFHFMRTPLWLQKSGMGNLQAKTFVADIQGPFSPGDKEALLMFFNMFWGEAEAEISAPQWARFRTITNPQSDDYILNRDDYAGFITYTMFTGEVKK